MLSRLHDSCDSDILTCSELSFSKNHNVETVEVITPGEYYLKECSSIPKIQKLDEGNLAQDQPVAKELDSNADVNSYYVESQPDPSSSTINREPESVEVITPTPVFKSTLTLSPAEIDANFYLGDKDTYNVDNPPFEYESFDRSKHLTLDNLWFPPYSKNYGLLNYALTLGLLIETGDLDGVTILLPNINMSLTENNSMYMQGTPFSTV
ncbi:hypothetical protein WA026_015147 [Henosepilachna vigintioctopunctata]|uniref:Uncharacterized protein n=1 Tax=Henosepilachna vigintioctopunctata TaxID=420089 RepID=A0AAW1TNP0_9CUCU